MKTCKTCGWTKGAFTSVVRTVRRLRSRPWRESQLISQDGQMIYTVRERDGEERQVLHLWRGWEPVSTARFSTLPCFEEYHRQKFNAAIPYTQNAPAEARSSRSLQPDVRAGDQP